MRTGGVIVTIFLITLQRARTYDESDERILEKIKLANNGDQFERLMALNLRDVSNVAAAAAAAAAVPDVAVLSYRSIFNLIPNENLTNVAAGTWATLWHYFGEDVGFVSKVMDTLENDERRVHFLTSVRIPVKFDSYTFAANYDQNRLTVLQTMTEDLIEASSSEENALNSLLQNRLLLLSAPSHFLLKLRDVHQLFLLAYAAAVVDTNNAFWKHRSSLSRRTWSKILLQRRKFAISLIEEQKNSGFFQSLNTINMTELQDLLTTLHVDQTVGAEFFAPIDWNTVQIRKIVDFTIERFNDSQAADIYGKFLSRLLPVQIVRAVQADTSILSADSDSFQNVDQVSLPQALQLSKYLITSSTVEESNCTLVGKLLYSQTNSFLSQLQGEALKMKIIKCLDSDKYSVLQAHYILGRNGLRDVRVNDNLLNLKGLIAAIPASYYFDLAERPKRDGSLENHFIHVLKYFPPHANKIAASAALHACKIVIDPVKCIASVLENGDNGVVSAMISALDIQQNVDDIWHTLRIKVKNDNEFKQRVAYLPSFVLTELLRKKELIITYDQLFNETYPIHLTIMGLNCEIISRIPNSEFLPIFEFYNRQRRLYNKVFPKNLQECARNVFLSYLRIKSSTSVAPLKANLLHYLDLSDIRSIGGFVLTTLPAKSIAKSKHRRNIVEEIGRLSLPELMLAAERSHLVSIASQYLHEMAAAAAAAAATVGQNEGNIRAEHLLTLGNLTHFLNDNYVQKIEAAAIKFVLEAEFIDTRVCACSKIRKAWADKLIEAFGSPQTWDEDTFLKIGDMLIVIDEPYFETLNETTASRVADLLKSKYKQSVEGVPATLSFYELCNLILPQSEQTPYKSSVTRLALFHAASIERLLDTIVETAESAALRAKLPFGRSNASANDEDIKRGSSTTDDLDQNEITTAETRTAGKTTTTTTTTTTTATGKLATASNFTFTSRESSSSSSERMAVSSVKTITRDQDDGQFVKGTVGESQLPRNGDEGEPITRTLATSPMWSITAQERILATTTTPFAPIETSRPAAVTTTITTTTTTTSSSSKTDSDDDSPTTTVDAVTDNFSTTAASTSINLDEKRNEREPAAVAYTTTITTTATSSIAADNVSSRTQREHASAITSSASLYSSSTDATAATAGETPVSSSYTSVTRGIRDTLTPLTVVFERQITGAESGAESDNDAADSASSTLPSFDRNRVLQTQPEQQQEQQQRQLVLNDLRVLENAVLRFLPAPDGTPFGYRSKRDVARQKLNAENGPKVGCATLKILDSMSDFIVGLPGVRFDIEEEDFSDCVELLARMDNLNAERRKEIWSRVAPMLSEANLSFVAGKILSTVSEAELSNDFNYNIRIAGALELISSLSDVSRAWSDETREKFIAKMIRDNIDATGLARAAQLPVFLRALGKLVCQLDDLKFFRLLKINDSLANMWNTFHALSDCPKACLMRLAGVAEKLYGDPLKWEASMLTVLGPVVAAIPKLHSHPNITRYFSASTIACSQRINTNTNTNTASVSLLTERHSLLIDTSFVSVVLPEDSLNLVPAPAPARTDLPPHSTSRANISRPFALPLYLVAVAVLVIGKFSFLHRYARYNDLFAVYRNAAVDDLIRR